MFRLFVSYSGINIYNLLLFNVFNSRLRIELFVVTMRV